MHQMYVSLRTSAATRQHRGRANRQALVALDWVGEGLLQRQHQSQPVRVRMLFLVMRENGSWSATEAAVEAQQQRLQAGRWRR